MALIHGLSQTGKCHPYASLVSKILRICALCAPVFLSTVLTRELTSVRKTSQLYNFKRRFGG